MSTKDWKDKELNSLLNERWGFSMDLSKLNESNCNSAAKKDELYEEEKSSEDSNEEEECPKCEASPCKCSGEKEKKKTNGKKLTKSQEKLPKALQDKIKSSNK